MNRVALLINIVLLSKVVDGCSGGGSGVIHHWSEVAISPLRNVAPAAQLVVRIAFWRVQLPAVTIYPISPYRKAILWYLYVLEACPIDSFVALK